MGSIGTQQRDLPVSRIPAKLPKRPPLDENLFSLIKEKFMAREIILNFVIDYLKIY